MTTIALVGNPNSGKTTLFNQYTGSHQYVGNWPGVTVERKAGDVRGHADVEMVDLPGIYSLSPYTKEEVVARNFLAEGGVDAILNIVDATNLERNLFLTEQLLEFGTPLVIALNQMDIVEKRGYEIDADGLAARLGVPVVEISALQGTGLDDCMNKVLEAASGEPPAYIAYSDKFEAYISEIAQVLPASIPDKLKRYYAVKTFELDRETLAQLQIADSVEPIVKKAEEEFQDDPEGIVTNERYSHITSFISSVYDKKIKGLTPSQKIDRVVTNRIAAIPIFIVIIGLVYYLAISTVGSVATDWANDGVFGDGWFLDPSPIVGIEGSQAHYDEAVGEYDTAQGCITAYVEAADEQGVEGAADIKEKLEAGEEVDDSAMDSFKAAAEEAHVSATYTPSDDETGEVLEDEAVTVDAATFDESLNVEEPDPTAFGIWIPGIPVLIENAMDALNLDIDWLKSLVLDGIVAGVGAVLGFVPQILILFFLLAILEGCGYMSRVAFILDRVFRRFGLSGKTFIPMIIGTGCGVPGIMATRTIESESARRLSVMTTTFMPCSAKLPIIALFAGAFFGGNGLIAALAYFVGIASIIISGLILKKTKPFAGKEAPFVMELPEYRLPRFIDLLRSMWERGWSFIKKAGTIILGSCVLIWFLSNFGFENDAFGMVESMDNSILAVIGNAICVIFTPLGWGNWRAAAAAVTGLIAKENLVGTLAVLYGEGAGLWANLAATYTAAAALSLMFFNLLCAPCFAAMGAIRREQQSAKWFWASVGYQCLYAYCVALCIFQFGSAIEGNVNPLGLAVAVIVVCFALVMIARPQPKFEEIPETEIVYTNAAPQISGCSDCSTCGVAADCDKAEKKRALNSDKKKNKKSGGCH